MNPAFRLAWAPALVVVSGCAPVPSYPRLEPRDANCAAKLKQRTFTNLYNERPAWLDFAHKRLDVAVAAAYGWPADLADEEILEKLLALNLERAAEEAKAAKVKKPRTSRLKHADELIYQTSRIAFHASWVVSQTIAKGTKGFAVFPACC